MAVRHLTAEELAKWSLEELWRRAIRVDEADPEIVTVEVTTETPS